MSARPELDEALIDQAIAWQQALARDDADWDAYLAWLEADPRHRLAFDEVALLDRVVEEHAPALAPLTASPAIEVPRPKYRHRWIGGALAAAIAVAIGVPALWNGHADIIYATGRGESRQVALEDGTSVHLAPSTRLIAIAGDPHQLELAQGEAYFAVRHDPSRTLSIRAGNYAVTDIGTHFSVMVAPELVAVAVAEGHVAVGSGGQSASHLHAGQQLVALRDDRTATVRAVPAETVGSWRQGRLVYNRTPLAVVAADLTRYSGKTVVVDPVLRDAQFSGVLAIGDGSRLVQNLAAIMAVGYRMDGDTVRLVAAPAR